MHDSTTLYFEAEIEDELRTVGYSKERPVDPQIVVGLVVDRAGLPLEIGCWEGNTAETATIYPDHPAAPSPARLADLVVVADAGMLSAGNIRELDAAGLTRHALGTCSYRRDDAHHVRARSGRPCRRCGATVRVARIGEPARERAMFYCPGCQGGLGPTDGRPQTPLGSSRGATRSRRSY